MDSAIVIGGSMGGLLAARVLSGHCKKVTLIERDCFPHAPGEQRRGVPQGRHTHGLLASGGAVLEKLFPGLTRELEAAGAVPCDPVREGIWIQERAALRQVESGMRGVLLSRPLLEGVVRERVLAIRNVECLQNAVVDGLLGERGLRVTGVRLQGGAELRADLVVDATGRGSHAPAWLEALGFAAPREERVEVGLAYSTRLFRRRSTDLGGKLLTVVAADPAVKQGGVMLAQEGDRWTVTLFSHFQAAPPLDLVGFLEFARRLHAPHIYETIRDAEPIGDGVPARMAASVRRRYEELAEFPEGLLVMGDAICSFDPIYGQGMSVAALEAVELDRALGVGGSGLAKRFFRAAAKVVDNPWAIAVGSDLRMPEATGPRGVGTRFVNWYVGELHKAAHRDDACSLAFHRVANLLEGPESLLRPGIAWRVWKEAVRRFVSRGDRQKTVWRSRPLQRT